MRYANADDVSVHLSSSPRRAHVNVPERSHEHRGYDECGRHYRNLRALCTDDVLIETELDDNRTHDKDG